MTRENLKWVVVLIAIIAISLAVGYGVGRMKPPTETERIERDTITYIDTVKFYQPIAKDSTVIRYVRQVLPVANHDTMTTYVSDTFLMQESGDFILSHELSVERDSIAVEIPIIQKRYEGEEYRAYISGYMPNLDSIFVFPQTTIIHEKTYKPPNRWNIGITAGYGYSKNSFSPFIGVGISYSIISFK